MQVINGRQVHSSRVVEGRTYCTDCGAHLRVGSYESMTHANKHGRGPCPNMDTEAGDEHFAMNRDGDGGAGYGNA